MLGFSTISAFLYARLFLVLRFLYGCEKLLRSVFLTQFEMGWSNRMLHYALLLLLHEELLETEILALYQTEPRAIASLGRIRTYDLSIQIRSNRFLHYMHVIVIVQRNFARGDWPAIRSMPWISLLQYEVTPGDTTEHLSSWKRGTFVNSVF